MAKHITKGGKHYGTADDVVARIEELEAALQAADELARYVDALHDSTGLSSLALTQGLAAYRKARGGET